ncbi:MAG TPA: Trm112 family protein [Woeseiaceae bacterium]|nr:Trm112 family protein [Woeseiaceae bacterium]
MDKRLLTILRCPVTHKGLNLAKSDVLARINGAIESGGLANRDGSVVSDSLDEALVTDDGKLAYPVKNGIPVLLEGESISLDQVD